MLELKYCCWAQDRS